MSVDLFVSVRNPEKGWFTQIIITITLGNVTDLLNKNII